MEDDIQLVWMAAKMAKAVNDRTQKSMAEEIGINQPLMNQYLKGARRMPDSTLLRVCWMLGVNPLEVRPSLVGFLEEAQSQLSSQTQNALAAQLQALTEPEKAEVEEYLSFLRSKRKR